MAPKIKLRRLWCYSRSDASQVFLLVLRRIHFHFIKGVGISILGPAEAHINK